MEQRKIVKENGMFMVLKREEFGWNRFGRRYDYRGIMNYAINTAKDFEFDINELPEDDRNYVSKYIEKGLKLRGC